MLCGEALPVETVGVWAEAAQNAIIENLYGPNELTIACIYYRWDVDHSPDLSEMASSLSAIPLNSDGKYDRKERVKQLEVLE
jgi:non-ribosomal peptide synthetase component F